MNKPKKKKLQACIASKELKIEVKATSGQRCAKLKGTPSCHKSKGRPKLVFYTCVKKRLRENTSVVDFPSSVSIASVSDCVCVRLRVRPLLHMSDWWKPKFSAWCPSGSVQTGGILRAVSTRRALVTEGNPSLMW